MGRTQILKYSKQPKEQILITLQPCIHKLNANASRLYDGQSLKGCA